MSSGAGTNTVTSNTSPPSNFVSALGNVGQQAIQTAQTPYQPYTGQMVAPMNDMQDLGIANLVGAQSGANPYTQASANEINASTAPLLPGVQPYLDQAGQYYNSAGNANLSSTVQPGISAAQSLYGVASNNAENLANYVQPGISAANNLYGSSAQQINPTQFSAGQVSQYESPYTQQVVNATQAQFNNQNQQQQAAVQGNAISQGAFGGDREAVAQGITAGQQQAAQAPVIAGLENQGYSQALNEFNTQQQVGVGAQEATQQLQQGAGAGILAGSNQLLTAQQQATQDLQNSAAGNLSASQLGLSAAGQNAQLQLAAGQGTAALGQTALGANEANAWLDSQAANSYAGLGNQVYNQTMGEGNALLGAGGLEQSQQQAELNVPYEQYTAAQAYPFQTESWLSGLEGQLANAAGGTASTTSPGPSPISQIGGLGLTGLAGYGLLNNAGLLGSSAAGGTAAGLSSAAGYGIDAAAAEAAGTAGASGIASGLGEGLGLMAAVKRGGNIPHRAGGGAFGSFGNVASFPTHRVRVGQGMGISGANDNMHFKGIPKLAMGGGATPPTMGLDAAPMGATRPMGGIGAGGAQMMSMGHHHGGMGGGPQLAQGQTFIPGSQPDPGSDPKINGFAGTMKRGGGIMRRDDGGSIPDDTDIPIPPIPPQGGEGGMSAPMATGTGIAPPAMPSEPAPGAAAPKSKVPWETLLSAGLNIMGGTSPFAAVNIGRGGQQGLSFGEQQRAREEQQALARLNQQETAKYHTGELDLRGQQIQQTGDLTKAQMAQTMTMKQAEMAQQLQLQKMQIGMEGARLAEEKAYHQQSLTPPEVRIFDAYNKMSPEDQQHFATLNMAQKGIPDLYSGSAIPPAASPAPSGAGGGSAAPSPTGDILPSTMAAPVQGAKNDQFLATLSPQYQPMVKALAEGRMAMPTKPSPLQQQIINAAGQYDPSFDATDFNKRNGTTKDFASGQSAKAITAINTATSHLSSLSDQMQALHNGDIPMVNSISNWIKTNTGQSAPTTATETRDAVANELRKVFATTGGGGLEELREWQNQFPINGSPTQQRDAIRQAVDLMQPRMESLAHQWNTGMGTNHQGLDLLSPSARDSWQKLTGGVPSTANASAPTYNQPGRSAAAPAAATPVQSGGMPRVNSPADAAKLPSGTRFLDPNGITRIVP